jgi:hypothetical protein
VSKFFVVLSLVVLLTVVLVPSAAAGGPGGGNNQGWFQKARTSLQNGTQRAFFNSGKAVRTGVPGVGGNDFTTSQGRAAFKAPNLGGSRAYNAAANAFTNAMRANSQ